MNLIRLYTAAIPRQLGHANSLLLRATPVEVTCFLPIILEEMEDLSAHCRTQVDLVTEECFNVLNVIGELHEALLFLAFKQACQKYDVVKGEGEEEEESTKNPPMKQSSSARDHRMHRVFKKLKGSLKANDVKNSKAEGGGKSEACQLSEEEKMYEKLFQMALDEQSSPNFPIMVHEREPATVSTRWASGKRVLAILRQGLAAFEELRERWTDLKLHFERFSSAVTSSLGGSEDLILKYAASRDIVAGVSSEIPRQIYPLVFEAVGLSNDANAMASCYCQVSREHIMPLASRLGSSKVLDSPGDDGSFERKEQRLLPDVEMVEAYIRQLVL